MRVCKIITFFFFFFVLQPYFAKPKSLPEETIEFFQKFKKKGIFTKLTAGVVTPTKVLWSYFDNTAQDELFRVASVTKMFTAMAVMRAIEEGKLDLSWQLDELYPDLNLEPPELYGNRITIRDLLSHRSGIPDLRFYKKPEWIEYPAFPFRIPRPIYPTKVHYRYANQNFRILGKILEKVYHKPLKEIVTEKVMQPIGAKHFGFYDRYSGAFGLELSFQALKAFAQTLLNEGENPFTGDVLVESDTLERMLEPQHKNDAAPSALYCGLGWRVKTRDHQVVTFFHIGGANTVAAWIQVFPVSKTAVFYLANPPKYENGTMSFLSAMQKKLSDLALYFTEQPKNLHDFTPTVYDDKVEQALIGEYEEVRTKEILKIFRKKDTLYFQEAEKKPVRMVKFGYRLFANAISYDRYEFYYDGETVTNIASPYGFYERLPNEKISMSNNH
ncbi:MAG: class C beta-lactamase-related serine hydrolase [Candidatus Hydrogenedentota bacterium]|nr:MAG: class C beta-lactamase-related serine hydrolase [Candidatus Hydrogenedentota bacterium]